MNKSRKIKNIGSNIFVMVLIIIAIVIYRKYDYNFYLKGISEPGKTEFSRDSQITTNSKRSYKISNTDYNDAMFYKEITVKEYTPYKVTCMIRTENVEQYNNSQIAGAQIVLKGTEEHSEIISGNSEWTKVEFCFNSKNKTTVSVGFRLGGNGEKAKGTAWFSDLQIEEGFQGDGTEWHFACIIFNEVDVKLENDILVKEQLTNEEVSNLISTMKRFGTTCSQITENKMSATYDVIQIADPITTLSYDEQNGYYISEKDVYNLIEQYISQKEYDHIFVCAKLPDEQYMAKDIAINWVGLGNMQYCGKGFSDIRVSDSTLVKNQYKYSSNNLFPEEVFLHEFLHTLERNSEEYGYEVPALHDSEQYGYKESQKEGLKAWYKDYMNKKIISNQTYIGLPEEIYKYKPIQLSNFTYSNKLDYLDEPKNINEAIKSITSKVVNLFHQKELNESAKGAAE